MSKSKYWCFTLNNYSDNDILELDDWKAEYLVCGREKGASGTPHLQGFVVWTRSRQLPKTCFQRRGHWEISKDGRARYANAIAYCKKEGDFIERGKFTTKGERTDLEEIKDQILTGQLKVNEIIVNKPELYHMYGRTLEKIEEQKLVNDFRTEQTTCEWIWGKTGVGKSHKAFENFDPRTTYVWKLNDKGWQDGYTGQPTVIINDFRGEIPYNELLNLVDKWPFTLPRRGKCPVPFLAKHIVITSSLPPHLVYKNREKQDSLEQLLRRITIQELI